MDESTDPRETPALMDMDSEDQKNIKLNLTLNLDHTTSASFWIKNDQKRYTQ